MTKGEKVISIIVAVLAVITILTTGWILLFNRDIFLFALILAVICWTFIPLITLPIVKYYRTKKSAGIQKAY
jgi:hypothetical protein